MSRATGQAFRISLAATPALLALLVSSCASSNPQPPPAPKPVVYIPVDPNPPQPDDWNLFPDPTTGQVDVYHKGGYVGSVTGDEPANQDPPIPHAVTTPTAE